MPRLPLHLGPMVVLVALSVAQARAQMAGAVNIEALRPLIAHLDQGGRIAITQATDSNGSQHANGNDWRRWGYEPWIQHFGFVGAAGHSPRTMMAGGVGLGYRGTNTAGNGDGQRIELDPSSVPHDFVATYNSSLDSRDFPPIDGVTRLGWLYSGRGVDEGVDFGSTGPPGTWGWTSWEFRSEVFLPLIQHAETTRRVILRLTYLGYPKETLIDGRSSAQPVIDQSNQTTERVSTVTLQTEPVDVRIPIPFSTLTTSSALRVYASDPLTSTPIQSPVMPLYGSIFPPERARARGIVVAPALGIRGGQSWFHHAIALSNRYYSAPYDAQSQSWPVSLTQTDPSYRQGPSVETVALWLSHLREAAGDDGYVLIRWSGSGNGRRDDHTRRLPDSPPNSAPDSPIVQVFNLVQCVDAIQRAWEHPVCGGDPEKLIHLATMTPNGNIGAGDVHPSGFAQDIVDLHHQYWSYLGSPKTRLFRPNLCAYWVSHDLTHQDFVDNEWRKNGTDNAHFSELGFEQLGQKEFSDLSNAAWTDMAAPQNVIDFADVLHLLRGFHDGAPSLDTRPIYDHDGVLTIDDLQAIIDLMPPVKD